MWRPLVNALLLRVSEADEASLTTIRQLMENPEYGVTTAAFRAILHTKYDDAEYKRLVHEAFASELPQMRQAALAAAGFRDLDQYAEAFEFLLADDEQIARGAREVLLDQTMSEPSKEPLFKKLRAVVEDADRTQWHVAALRAMGVLRCSRVNFGGGGVFREPAWIAEANEFLDNRLRTGPPAELAAAAWARFGKDWKAARQVFGQWATEVGMSEERSEALFALEPALAKEAEAALGSAEYQPRFGGGGYF